MHGKQFRGNWAYFLIHISATALNNAWFFLVLSYTTWENWYLQPLFVKLDLALCIQRGPLNRFYPLCTEALVHIKVKRKVIWLYKIYQWFFTEGSYSSNSISQENGSEGQKRPGAFQLYLNHGIILFSFNSVMSKGSFFFPKERKKTLNENSWNHRII